MRQCFRIRFTLSGPVRINSPEKQVVLAQRPHDTEDVVLHGLGEGIIEESHQLVVEGRDYEDEAEALMAGDRWRGWLEKAFAAVDVGADFGDRAASTSGVPDSGVSWWQQHLGTSQPILNDVHGVMTYQCEPRPRFISGHATLGTGRPVEPVLSIANARVMGDGLGGRQRLAYDLYSASFTLEAADARFVMLMMAIEALLDPAPREGAARAHVEQVMTLTEKADLPSEEKQSLLGSLRWLLDESISRTGRRLAATLGGKTYFDQRPGKFFTDCYGLRSQLVHGHTPRPSVGAVNARCAPLQEFLTDLLAGDLKASMGRSP
jgi:hypothetical protein